MADAKTYTGGCHCGAVRFRVTMPLEGVLSCNCSICAKTGALLAFAPAAQLELELGEDALADYQFGKKRIHHLFCKRCGIRSFARGLRPDGAPVVAVNARCLDGVDAEALPVRHFDGKSLPLE